MCKQILYKTQNVMVRGMFISLSANEMIIIDIQYWILVHVDMEKIAHPFHSLVGLLKVVMQII